MIKIQHRVNSINKLNNLNRNFGAEIDIRSFNKKLILNYEPFEKGELLNVYLKKFNHKFLILNIKEEYRKFNFRLFKKIQNKITFYWM